MGGEGATFLKERPLQVPPSFLAGLHEHLGALRTDVHSDSAPPVGRTALETAQSTSFTRTLLTPKPGAQPLTVSRNTPPVGWHFSRVPQVLRKLKPASSRLRRLLGPPWVQALP